MLDEKKEEKPEAETKQTVSHSVLETLAGIAATLANFILESNPGKMIDTAINVVTLDIPNIVNTAKTDKYSEQKATHEEPACLRTPSALSENQPPSKNVNFRS